MQLSIIDIDLSKTSCSLVGMDLVGEFIVRRRIRRDTIVILCSRCLGIIVA